MNVETPRECLNHVQKELEEINLHKELACVKASMEKRQDEEAQKWPNEPKVACDCQKQQKN